MAKPIEPYRVMWTGTDGQEYSKDHTTRRKAVAEARPLLHKNMTVSMYRWENSFWEDDDEAMQLAMTTRKRVAGSGRKTTGSHDAYVALDHLANVARYLAPLARKRALTLDEEDTLTEATSQILALFEQEEEEDIDVAVDGSHHLKHEFV